MEAQDYNADKRAGLNAGRKEAMNWGDEPCPHELSSVEILDDNGDVIGERLFAKRECNKCWQGKLKEWGIK